MFKIIGKLYDFILYACVVLAGILIGIGILLVVVDVSMRAIGLQPMGFTVAFVEYILLYFVLLAAPYLVRHKGHVYTDMLIGSLRPPLRRVLEKFVYAVCILVSGVFAVVGWMLFVEAIRFGYVDERSVDIPYWALYLLFPPCFTMIAIEFARYLFGGGSMYQRDDTLEAV